MVLALYMDFVPKKDKERLISDLKKKLEKNTMHLDTGFIGTIFLCQVLSSNGLPEDAYTLLLNEDYPSWLYEVNMGATTIWERWNSVLPDGLVSDTGMNSMNHYAYGSIVEWMYRFMCGINPVESAPGFKKTVIKPQINKQIDWVEAEYLSAAGLYKSSWKHTKSKTIYSITIPFDAEAEFVLQEKADRIFINGEISEDLLRDKFVILTAGSYEIVVQ